jgi:hypothetical protein
VCLFIKQPLQRIRIKCRENSREFCAEQSSAQCRRGSNNGSKNTSVPAQPCLLSLFGRQELWSSAHLLQSCNSNSTRLNMHGSCSSCGQGGSSAKDSSATSTSDRNCASSNIYHCVVCSKSVHHQKDLRTAKHCRQRQQLDSGAQLAQRQGTAGAEIVRNSELLVSNSVSHHRFTRRHSKTMLLQPGCRDAGMTRARVNHYNTRDATKATMHKQNWRGFCSLGKSQHGLW